MTATQRSSVLQIPIVQEVDKRRAHLLQLLHGDFHRQRPGGAVSGATADYTLAGQLDVTLPGNYYTAAYGRGCVNGAPGFSFTNTPQTGCDYNGARWFDGPRPTANETFAHPNGCSAQNNTGTNFVTCYNNAGSLTGVDDDFRREVLPDDANVWRNVEGMIGGATRGGGLQRVLGRRRGHRLGRRHQQQCRRAVRREPAAGGSWGILNQSAAQPFAGAFDVRGRS